MALTSVLCGRWGNRCIFWFATTKAQHGVTSKQGLRTYLPHWVTSWRKMDITSRVTCGVKNATVPSLLVFEPLKLPGGAPDPHGQKPHTSATFLLAPCQRGCKIIANYGIQFPHLTQLSMGMTQDPKMEVR